jgi:hypothetical protein
MHINTSNSYNKAGSEPSIVTVQFHNKSLLDSDPITSSQEKAKRFVGFKLTLLSNRCDPLLRDVSYS